MKKLALLCIAALGAALMVLGTAPAASAYPELTCTISVDRQVVRPGQTFTVTGDSEVVDNGTPASAEPNTWTFTFDGVTKKRAGAIASARFQAPQVDSTRDLRLTATNTTSIGNCERSLDITVIGPKVAGPQGPGGLLPNTGGPAFWLVLVALLLVAGGGTVLVRNRRQH